MAYKHGVYTLEAATSIISPVNTTAGLPVIYGTAPVHLATDRAEVNKPILCHTYAEALAAFGYSDNWEDFTLCEAIPSYFTLYGVAPVVLVNVLDRKTHLEKSAQRKKQLQRGLWSCPIRFFQGRWGPVFGCWRAISCRNRL